MLMRRLNVKFSTSVQLMELVVFPSTVSSVPTEPSSTRTTSSATGGSTLTAPQPRTSTASMTNMLLRETPSPLLQVTPKLTMLLPLLLTQDTLPPLNTPPKVLVAVLADRDLLAVITEEDSKQTTSECDRDYTHGNFCIKSYSRFVKMSCTIFSLFHLHILCFILW